MPYYEFECQCGKSFEERLPIDQRNNEVKCECGKLAKRKTFNNINLHGFDNLGRSK